jgi:hypothetical protein
MTAATKSYAMWRITRWLLVLRNWSVAAVVRRGGAFAQIKALAPYALIELILPGGSVMALLLWLYRRRKNAAGFGRLSRTCSVPS